jgi:hypothetical protein
MKFIFLDIDGVMNHHNHMVRSRHHFSYEFCPVAVQNLREIIKRTGAYIILSSTWRKGMHVIDIRILFNHYDLGQYVIGATPVFHDQIRGNEIKDLLNRLDEPPESIVILDDDADMGELMPYLVQCKDYCGLTTDELRERAVQMLNHPYTARETEEEPSHA